MDAFFIVIVVSTIFALIAWRATRFPVVILFPILVLILLLPVYVSPIYSTAHNYTANVIAAYPTNVTAAAANFNANAALKAGYAIGLNNKLPGGITLSSAGFTYDVFGNLLTSPSLPEVNPVDTQFPNIPIVLNSLFIAGPLLIMIIVIALLIYVFGSTLGGREAYVNLDNVRIERKSRGIDGVEFSPKLYKLITEKKLTPQQAVNIQNAEQRQVALKVIKDAIGWGAMLTALHAKVVDTEIEMVDGKKITYQLFEVNLRDDPQFNKARFIKVQDISTGKETILRVPLIATVDINTCRSARAITFKMNADEYDPKVET